MTHDCIPRQRVRLSGENEESKQRNLDETAIVARDPDIFTLIMTSCEINRSYLEEIEKTITSSAYQDSDVVIDSEKGNYRITKGSLQRLKPGKWFNDEIVNGYVSLINLREKEMNIGHAFAFNSFFYTLLSD